MSNTILEKNFMDSFESAAASARVLANAANDMADLCEQTYLGQPALLTKYKASVNALKLAMERMSRKLATCEQFRLLNDLRVGKVKLMSNDGEVLNVDFATN